MRMVSAHGRWRLTDASGALRNRVHRRTLPGSRVERRVISLKGSPRLKGFFDQDPAASFVVFDAVDTRDGTLPPEFDMQAFTRRYDRAPLPGEVGCVLSHLAVMREFVKTANDRDLLIVAEDDALLSPHFDTDLPAVIRLSTHADIVVLANSMSTMDGPYFDRGLNWLTVSPLGSVMFRLFPRPRWRRISLVEAQADLGTICYVVSARGARSLLLRASQGVSWVADDYRLPRELGLRTYHVRPYLAQQNPDESSGIRQHAEQPIPSQTSWRTRLRIRTRLRRWLPAIRLAACDLIAR